MSCIVPSQSCRQLSRNPLAHKTPLSSRSLFGLDAINFFMADVRDGVGPFLSVYLAGTLHWPAGRIGAAMATSTLAAAICQIPAGWLVDATHRKRSLMIGAAGLIGFGCLMIVWQNGFLPIIGAQLLLGAASAVIPPAIAAISLGLVGANLLPSRISRNESFNHAGSFAAAALAGISGQYLGQTWIFYMVCLFAIASAAATLVIDPARIDHETARGGDAQNPESAPIPIRDLLRRPGLATFLGAIILFHTANAAMLPLAGQMLAQRHPGTDTIALSACILCAQLVMVGAAFACGWALRRGIGRKPVFLIAFLLLPIRGVIFAFVESPVAVIGAQLLDGVAAGIFGVLSVIIVADVTRGAGRFNMTQGAAALAVGLGASLSNVLGGYLVQYFGYHRAFLFLATIALGGLLFFMFLMPETAPDEARIT